MSKNQVKSRQCLGKHCGALKKLEHPYWDSREKLKQLKKENKAKKNEQADKMVQQ